MSTLQFLSAESQELSSVAIGMLKSFVTAAHRETTPLSELSHGLRQNIIRFAANVEATEKLWLDCRESWAGGQTVIDPQALESMFDGLNSLMTDYEVTLWSFDKLFERTEQFLPDASPQIAEQCDGFLQQQPAVSKIRAQLSDMRAGFDSVMKCIRKEVEERGITELELFEEEMDARVELARINPSFQKWDEIARGSGAPEYMKDEPGGPCPF